MDKIENDFAEELNTFLDTLKNGPINDDERVSDLYWKRKFFTHIINECIDILLNDL